MATWAKQTTLTAEHIINVVSSGTKLYFVGKATSYGANRPLYTAGDIWEYDLATLTQTKIVQTSVIGAIGFISSICWFRDELYILIQSDDGGFPIHNVAGYVYKWDGTTDNISLVHTVYSEAVTFPLTIGAAEVFRLFTDGSTMVVLAVHNNLASTNLIQIVQSTTNGSSYSSGSLPFTAVSTIGSGSGYTFASEWFPGSIYEVLLDAADSLWKAVVFSGGSFATHQATLPAEFSALLYTDPSETFHWTTYNSSDYWLNAAMSVSTQSSPAIPAIIQNNLDYSVGIEVASGDVYFSTNGNWTLLDAASFAFSSTTSWMIRSDDTQVWLIGRNSATSDSEVWLRSEGIPFPAAPVAKFYSGLDTLTYRSDLPFAGVNPGGMAVLKDRTVVLGSNAAAAQSVVFSQPESYPTWTDMTPVIPTGTSVTSIKNV